MVVGYAQFKYDVASLDGSLKGNCARCGDKGFVEATYVVDAVSKQQQ